MKVWAVVVAGGQGSRFGCPKQFESLAGRRVLDWSVEAAHSVAGGVVVVVPAGSALEVVGAGDAVVHGGHTRSASVRAGLACVPEDAEVVVVHDAARPLASRALFASVVAALEEREVAGVVPAIAVAETLKRVDADRVVATVPRHGLVTVQTPQAFRREALVGAHREGGEGTDDAALVEAAGGVVLTVPGEMTNLKLTVAADLQVAEWHLAQREAAAGRPRPERPRVHLGLRTGLGFDVHRFDGAPPRALVLGGVVFPGESGLAGHSDGDVVCHAVADALLGAAGLGDIGQHFSDLDPAWEGADSLDILARVAGMLRDAGWCLANADCSVVLDAPRLAPHRAAMAANLTQAAGGQVSVKAKRAEGLGALGRGEGIACLATVLVEQCR